MKTIGFIDYYMSNWHANNYPVWIKEACADMNEQYKVAYAWAEQDVSPRDGITTDEWCAKFGVQRCGTIEELCERSDCIMILAPADADRHLTYAKAAFPFGKPTFVDKTFAPDLATAKEIFALGQAHRTPFFSTSALRYATELNDIASPNHLSTWGDGNNFSVYVIHQIEMIVKVMQSPCIHAKTTKTETGYDCALSFTNGKTAEIHYSPKSRFALEADGRRSPIHSTFHPILIADILRFFETRQCSFDQGEILEAMRIREMILQNI